MMINQNADYHFFKEIVDNSPDMIVRYNKEFQHIYCNAAVERHFNLPVDFLIGKTFLDLQTDGELGEQFALMHGALVKCSETVEEVNANNSLPLPGGYRHYATRITPEQGEDGAVKSFLAVTRDVTGVKTAEALAKKQDVFYRAIVENANEAIMVVQGWNLKYVNPAAAEIIGYPEQDLLNTQFERLIYHEDVKSALEKYEMFLNGDNPRDRFPVRIISGDGTLKWLEFSGELINWNEEQALLGFVSDITESKAIEAALLDSEKKFRLIFERAPLGILRFDHDGIITDCNDNFVDIIGSSHEVLVGLNMLNLPDQVLVTALKGALSGELTDYEDNYKSITADKVTPVRLIFAPLFSEDGSVGGGIGIVEDITERKHAEESIRYISFHDTLTGLYNRHYMNEELQRLNVQRQMPLSIIMADLNGLKLVNDTYGHHIGDEMLKMASSVLKESCREEDVVARLGGDEFIILLPGTPSKDAEAIAKRIELKCRTAVINDVPVSIALGLVTNNDAPIDPAVMFKEAEDNMYKQKLTESRSTKSAVVGAMLRALSAKSFETEAHTLNMQALAREIGEAAGLPDSELKRLELVITLHDIGKISIPEDILLKKEPLNADEWQTIKKHPETGYRIALATEQFAHVAEEILSHHERWDGTGYPRGLVAENIPLLARITAVADAVEVMTNGRPYKKTMPQEQVTAELKKCAGTHFDPHLAELALTILSAKTGRRYHQQCFPFVTP